ncbi:MAG: ABC transporter permease [Rhodospirillaceae bacterium]|jgi:peptide/nickel transport system permease protein|uniref:ABC transporter permease n=1 Tax=unclassified Hwanghaeella TaxID=2605944 RepID=UPI000C493DF9|nr:ABC transporter permease [Rhodospirillaceae bacterium]|tara:strand:- start:1360 stop:2325 length:966 start_codon:yes stop_codon:yes gene_type:complete
MESHSHPVLAMLVNRIGLGLLSLLIVSIVIFSAVSMLPGDFASAILGQTATPEAVTALQHKLGLDLPWPQRYVVWLMDAVRGDLGDSFSGRPVIDVIGPRLYNTLLLAASTAIFAVPLAVGLGIVCARFRGRFIDKFFSTSSLAAISVPEFFLAYILMMLLSVNLHLLPSMSSIRMGMSLGEQMIRMVLPILTLMLVVLAHMIRNTRAAILGVMASPYVEMARLNGEPEKRVVLRHALPNAIGPIASVLAINLAYLISGVVVIEVVFVYPGVGQTMVDAVRNRDVPVIQACALIFAVTYIGLNMIADIISIVSNPRLLHPR